MFIISFVIIGATPASLSVFDLATHKGFGAQYQHKQMEGWTQSFKLVEARSKALKMRKLPTPHAAPIMSNL